MHARNLGIIAISATWLLTGCSTPDAPKETPVSLPQIDTEIYRRAERERADRLAGEVDRLRADLRAAEEALVAAESGLRGQHGRADAVSSLAEVRIQVERSARDAPWRIEEITEARDKVQEADRQVREGHFGAALFFVYRARRIADQLAFEAKQVRGSAGTHFVGSPRVNLRSGPSTKTRVLSVLTKGTPVFPEGSESEWMLVRTTSGSVGWLHNSLLDANATP